VVTGHSDKFTDFTVAQPNPVCIPGFGVELPFGQEMHFISDILVDACGWEGYPSNTPFNLSGTIHRPWCFWMGGEVWTAPAEHVKRARFPRMAQFHLPSFMGDDNIVKQLNTAQSLPLICESSPKVLMSKRVVKDDSMGLLIFNNEMTYGQTTITDPKIALDRRYWQWSNSKTATPENRKAVKADDWPLTEMANFQNGGIRKNKQGYLHQWKNEYSITTSDNPQWTARAICTTPRRIVGPDWANARERKYCILSQQRVIDWCNHPADRDCFDDVKEEVRGPPDDKLKRWLGWETAPRKLTTRWDYD
jgi:hypothetical protein